MLPQYILNFSRQTAKQDSMCHKTNNTYSYNIYVSTKGLKSETYYTPPTSPPSHSTHDKKPTHI
jgi:hypothetical protein